MIETIRERTKVKKVKTLKEKGNKNGDPVKKRRKVSFNTSNDSPINVDVQTDQGSASINKLIEVAQSHMTNSDTDRLGSITKSLPIIHEESEIVHSKEEKQDRSITRELAKKNLRKWNYFVKQLNTAEHVQFPLRSSAKDVTLHTMASISSPTQPETSLEKKLSEIYARTGLYDEEPVVSVPTREAGIIPFKKTSKDEAANEDDLDPAEYVTTPNILSKLKAAMSYDVQKRQRANKIKSKQYHRMRRKEEDKAREAMIKQMYEVDPKAAVLRQKQHLEKQRAYERATMRHKNTSKYMKHIKRVAMWDSEKREALQQQDRIHQERTEKPQLWLNSNDTSDEEDTHNTLQDPLTGRTLPEDNFEKSRDGLRRMAFMQKQPKQIEDADDAIIEDVDEKLDVDDEFDESAEATLPTHAITQSAGRVHAENHSEEPMDIHIPQMTNDFDRDGPSPIAQPEKITPESQTITESHKTEQEELIRQAFAEDDILANLIKEKEAAIEKEARPVDTNQALPGWNEWGGIAEDDSELNRTQKARMSRLEAKRKIELDALRQKRKDLSLAHVYINEEAEAAVPEKYVARKPPYPFESQAQYEESIRLPLGKEWNTALTVKQRTTPAVRTKKGKIIEPLDSGVRLRKTPRTKIKRTE